MQLEKSLACVAAFAKPEKFEDLRRNIDVEWIEQALQATGTATIRRRRLPAEQVVWLVIGMGLFRNRSIHDVVSKLDLVLPGDTPTVLPSAVADARSRLGAEPMEWFERGAQGGQSIHRGGEPSDQLSHTLGAHERALSRAAKKDSAVTLPRTIRASPAEASLPSWMPW